MMLTTHARQSCGFNYRKRRNFSLANRRNLPNFNSPISYFYIAHYWLHSKFTKLSSANLLRKAIRQTKVPPGQTFVFQGMLSGFEVVDCQKIALQLKIAKPGKETVQFKVSSSKFLPSDIMLFKILEYSTYTTGLETITK